MKASYLPSPAMSLAVRASSAGTNSSTTAYVFASPLVCRRAVASLATSVTAASSSARSDRCAWRTLSDKILEITNLCASRNATPDACTSPSSASALTRVPASRSAGTSTAWCRARGKGRGAMGEYGSPPNECAWCVSPKEAAPSAIEPSFGSPEALGLAFSSVSKLPEKPPPPSKPSNSPNDDVPFWPYGVPLRRASAATAAASPGPSATYASMARQFVSAAIAPAAASARAPPPGNCARRRRSERSARSDAIAAAAARVGRIKSGSDARSTRARHARTMPLRANAWPSAPTTGSGVWWAPPVGVPTEVSVKADLTPNAAALPDTAPARNADPTTAGPVPGVAIPVPNDAPAGVPGTVSCRNGRDGSRLATTVAATSASTAEVATALSRSSAPSDASTTSRAMSSTRGPASRRISADVDASSSFCSAAAFSARSTSELTAASESDGPAPPARAAASTEPGSCAALAGLTYRRNESSAA